MISPARVLRGACLSLWSAAVLSALAAAAATAVAQTTVTAPMRIPDMSHDEPRKGVLRQLVCRGRAGLEVTRKPDSAPDSRSVIVSLAYRPNPRPPGLEYAGLEPGSCSWNPLGDAGVPPEPGTVHFDLAREGSAYVPDPTTFARHLGDPEHFWLFYVDDVTNVALSHGSYRTRFWAGDDVRDVTIRAVARHLTNAMRRTDVVARYGGEEFVVIMPGTTPAVALERIESLRRQLSETPLDLGNGHVLTVSFSAGVAGSPDDAAQTTADELVSCADQRLLAAKRDGRGRVYGAGRTEVTVE